MGMPKHQVYGEKRVSLKNHKMLLARLTGYLLRLMELLVYIGSETVT